MSEKVELDGDGVPLEAEGFSEKERAANRPGETGTKKPEAGTKKRDWVEEAYKCFIKDAKDIDPTDPISAVAAYFAKNATKELKARCKAEGKNATLCWRFIEEVARKALGGRSGHIDPAVVYAIAMHYFEDVPKDWDGAPPKKKLAPNPPTPSEIRKEKAKAAKEKAKAKKAEAKKRKPKAQQGFFFDMLMQPDAQKPSGASSPQESPVAPAEETAVAPSAQAGSNSESEVQE